jgi:hypothetical protein
MLLKGYEADKSPSYLLLSSLVEGISAPISALNNDVYYARTGNLLKELVALQETHARAGNREGELGNDDPLVANIILTQALRDKNAPLSLEQKQLLQQWITDTRFSVLIGVISAVSSGSVTNALSYFYVDTQLTDDMYMEIARVAKSIQEMLCSQYLSLSSYGYDLTSSVVNTFLDSRKTEQHFSEVVRHSAFVCSIIKQSERICLDLSNPENITSSSFKSDQAGLIDGHALTQYAQDYGSALSDALNLVSYVSKEAIYDLERYVANDLIKIIESMEAIAKESGFHLYASTDIFFYSVLFPINEQSIFDLFNKSEISKYFRILLTVCHRIISKELSDCVRCDLKDVYSGADKVRYKDLLRYAQANPYIKDLYSLLISLGEPNTDLYGYADGLADKCIQHHAELKEISQQGEVPEDIRATLREHFFPDNMDRRARSNSQTIFELRLHLEKVINFYRSYKNSELTFDQFNHFCTNQLKHVSGSARYLLYRRIAKLEKLHFTQALVALSEEEASQISSLTDGAEVVKKTQAKKQSILDKFSQEDVLLRSVFKFSSSDIALEITEDAMHVYCDSSLIRLVTWLIDKENRKHWGSNRAVCIRKSSQYYKAAIPLMVNFNKKQGVVFDAVEMVYAQYDTADHSSLKRKRKAIKLKQLIRWKRVRYAFFVLLGLVGLTALGLATASTLGFIHFSWLLVPTIYFAVGGSTVGVGVAGILLNKQSRRAAFLRFLSHLFHCFSFAKKESVAEASQDNLVKREQDLARSVAEASQDDLVKREQDLAREEKRSYEFESADLPRGDLKYFPRSSHRSRSAKFYAVDDSLASSESSLKPIKESKEAEDLPDSKAIDVVTMEAIKQGLLLWHGEQNPDFLDDDEDIVLSA